MSVASKKAQQVARRLFQLSLVGGAVSPERVSGVLEYVEKSRPANPLAVLKAYHRLIAAEIARSSAVVEHAGALPATLLADIAASLSKSRGRPITATGRQNPSLIAGMRVRLGDDVFETSVAAQLASLRPAI